MKSWRLVRAMHRIALLLQILKRLEFLLVEIKPENLVIQRTQIFLNVHNNNFERLFHSLINLCKFRNKNFSKLFSEILLKENLLFCQFVYFYSQFAENMHGWLHWFLPIPWYGFFPELSIFRRLCTGWMDLNYTSQFPQRVLDLVEWWTNLTADFPN